MKTPKQVLEYVNPILLIIEKPEGEGIVLHLELNCDWEEEHGMEWLIRDDEVLYVGSFDGVLAWDEKEEYKDLSGNYVFYNIHCEDEKI